LASTTQEWCPGFYTDSGGDAHGFIDRNGHFTTVNAPGAGPASGQGTFVANMNNLGVIAGFDVDARASFPLSELNRC
jgi:hypothetical protein